MTGGIKIVNNPAFQKTLLEYSKLTKRGLSTILNTKGYYIARAAARETHKVEAKKIEKELVQAYEFSRVSKGKNAGKSRKGKMVLAPAFGGKGTRAELILNAKLAKQGKSPLIGKKLLEAAIKMVKTRMRAHSFIASGWIQSIKGFEPLAEKRSLAVQFDRRIKQYGRAKGGFLAARESWSPKAVLWNSAAGKRGTAALSKHAYDGLQIAINSEIKSMREYITRKLQEISNKFSTKKH